MCMMFNLPLDCRYFEGSVRELSLKFRRQKRPRKGPLLFSGNCNALHCPRCAPMRSCSCDPPHQFSMEAKMQRCYQRLALAAMTMIAVTGTAAAQEPGIF